jgi:TPR repeat protein
LSGIGIEANVQVGIENLRRVADQNILSAQLRCATLFRRGLYIQQNLSLSARYFKTAADRGSIEGQLEYADFLIRGDGISKDFGECEKYVRLAVDQGSVQGRMRLGIYLMSDVFGRFDFKEARELFDLASRSLRFAVVLRDSLSNLDCELMNLSDFSSKGNIFSILRSSSNESTAMIRLLNLDLCPITENPFNIVQVWQNFAG